MGEENGGGRGTSLAGCWGHQLVALPGFGGLDVRQQCLLLKLLRGCERAGLFP